METVMSFIAILQLGVLLSEVRNTAKHILIRRSEIPEVKTTVAKFMIPVWLFGRKMLSSAGVSRLRSAQISAMRAEPLRALRVTSNMTRIA